ncbi:MAG: MiaB/RimO family radical SAM methylthiotransferase [bacterium]
MITFFFKTYGCLANVADSQSVAKYLKLLGCDDVATEDQADIIIINTCAVRDKAEQKLFSYIGQLIDLKKKRPYLNVGIMGCVASYKKDEIYKRFDLVNFVHGARDDINILQAFLADLVVKLETKKQLFDQQEFSGQVLLEELEGGAAGNPKTVALHTKIWSGGQAGDLRKRFTIDNLASKYALASKGRIDFDEKLQDIKPFKKELELNRSFITIMTGCNKYCDYCIVPFTRGREVSFSAQAILDRISYDVTQGAREVTLVGQNVNSYKDPVTGADFSELLRQVAAMPGEFWVRWMSPHPQDMTPELFDVISAHQDRIPAYVHFPVQSGSNRILELMKRNYTREYYLEQIKWLRDRMPDAVISTDIIVGFPGETEEDFVQTYDLLEKVRFDFSYLFIYSPRQYTGASKREDSCSKQVKNDRLELLKKRQLEIALEKNSERIGTIMKTLVEKRLTNGKLLARTQGNIRVLFNGDDSLIGNFVDVKIDTVAPTSFFATILRS